MFERNNTTKTYNKDEFEIKFQKNEKLHEIDNVELQISNGDIVYYKCIKENNLFRYNINKLSKIYDILTNCFENKNGYHVDLQGDEENVELNITIYMVDDYNEFQTKIILFPLQNKPIMYLHKNGLCNKIIYEHDQEIDFSQYDLYSCNNIVMTFNSMTNLIKISCSNLLTNDNDNDNNNISLLTNNCCNILSLLNNYIINIPSLVELNIYVNSPFDDCQLVTYDKFQSIPNLEKITFVNCCRENYNIYTLNLIKSFTKLVSITYLNCTDHYNNKCIIAELGSIKKWCEKKCIVLTIMDE